MIEFDVETTGLQWYADELFMVQFGDENGNVEVLEHPRDAERIQEWLSEDDDYRAWNTKFDLHFLASAGYELPPEDRWHDGMVVAQLVDERFSAALKARASKLFGNESRDLEKKVKDELAALHAARRKEHKERLYDWLEDQGFAQKRNKLPQVPDGLAVPEHLRWQPPNYADVDRVLMGAYAAQDISLTRRVGAVYDPQLDTQEVRGVYEKIERPALAALFRLERRGLPIDEAATRRLFEASERRLDALTATARELSGKSNFNPSSPKQVGEALERLGADLSFVTQTDAGNPKTDEENLTAVDHPLAQAILDFRGESKLYGTYLYPMFHDTEDRKRFIAADGRVHSNIRQVGAKTGRMSSSDPNVQNWHRDDLRLRYIVRAGAGNKLVVADMEAVEARVLAMYTAKFGGGRLLKTLREGGDIHTLTAELVGLKGRKRPSGFESPRQQGKRFNYLVMYGGGVRAIRKWFLVPQARAREMLDRYYQVYPEIRQLQDSIQWRLADRRYITTLYGRRQRLERDVRSEGYKFLNYLIQGTSADMFKMALVRLHEQGVPLVGVYHDELLAEVPEAEAEHTAALMEEALTDFPEVTEYVPLDADASIVDRWSQAKDPDFIPEHEKVPA